MIHPIPNMPQYGIRIVVCTNDELVAGTPSGYDAHSESVEVTREAAQAADAKCEELLGGYADSDGIFRNWQGGRYYGGRPDINHGHVVANLYTRELEDADDPDSWSEWEWAGWFKDAPEDLREAAGIIVTEIGEAHATALSQAHAEAKSRALSYAAACESDGDIDAAVAIRNKWSD
jgi:hypothetical protein